jgi:hypothetical protein
MMKVCPLNNFAKRIGTNIWVSDAEREFTKQKAVEELAEIERIFAKLKDR